VLADDAAHDGLQFGFRTPGVDAWLYASHQVQMPAAATGVRLLEIFAWYLLA